MYGSETSELRDDFLGLEIVNELLRLKKVYGDAFTYDNFGELADLIE